LCDSRTSGHLRLAGEGSNLRADHPRFGVKIARRRTPETSDVRESPGVRIANVLLSHGADAVLHDPLVRIDAVRDQLAVSVTQAHDVTAAATGADAIVIATGWDAYRRLDWTDIAQRMRSPIILDGRQVVSANNLSEETILLATGSACRKGQRVTLVRTEQEKPAA
jgi:UDP-glucose/GDP-mannose dehydrogenase family, UDP binding domain